MICGPIIEQINTCNRLVTLHYLLSHNQLLVGLVALGTLEILGHREHQAVHLDLGYLAHLQPIREKVVNTGTYRSMTYSQLAI